MKDVRSTLRYIFFEYLIIPRDLKQTLIFRNLKHLKQILPVLIIFSGVMLPLAVAKADGNVQEHLYEIWYYTAILSMSSICLVLAYIFSKVKNMNPMVRNSPLFLIFTGFMVLCYVTFISAPIMFNVFVLFICVITITPLVFAIEPLVYNPMLIIVYIAIAPRVYNTYGMSAVLNVLIYVAVTFILGIQRWLALKQTLIHEKMKADHEKKLQQELEMAATVQKSFYSNDLTSIEGWNIACFNDPMMSLSGDLFDFFVRRNRLNGLCIFDVSGHGLSAGLVTMLVKNTMEEEFYRFEDHNLGFTMSRINERVRREKGNIENYLTGILLRFTQEGIEMADAGHPIPIIYRAQKDTTDFLDCNIEDCHGVIGLGDLNFNYKQTDISLNTNDRLFLYTDGFTEARNEAGEEYGKERFLESIGKYNGLPVEAQLMAIKDDLRRFRGKAPVTDDVSLIILEKL